MEIFGELAKAKPIRPGEQVSARTFNAMLAALKLLSSMSIKGAGMVIDADGIHMRQTPVNVEGAFWGRVQSIDRHTAFVLEVAGALPNAQVINADADPIPVFIGENTHIRGPEGGSLGDLVYCMPNPPSITSHPYFGISWIEGFYAEEPDLSLLSPIQDDTTVF